MGRFPLNGASHGTERRLAGDLPDVVLLVRENLTQVGAVNAAFDVHVACADWAMNLARVNRQRNGHRFEPSPKLPHGHRRLTAWVRTLPIHPIAGDVFRAGSMVPASATQDPS
jgi:hypothetical protein